MCARRARQAWRGLGHARGQCDEVDKRTETRAVGNTRGQGLGARIHSNCIVLAERHKHGGGRGATHRARDGAAPGDSDGLECARVRGVDSVHEIRVRAQETESEAAGKDAALVERDVAGALRALADADDAVSQ